MRWMHRKCYFWNSTSQIVEKFCDRPVFAIVLERDFHHLKRCKTVTSEEVNATKNFSITNRINNHVLKWKIHAYFLFHFSFWRYYFNFVKNYKLRLTNSVISCFTLSSAFIILADIIFYNFFRIHSFNLIWENIFVINFSMLAYSPKNCQNPPRVIKHFLLMLPYWTKSGIGYLQVLLDNI